MLQAMLALAHRHKAGAFCSFVSLASLLALHFACSLCVHTIGELTRRRRALEIGVRAHLGRASRKVVGPSVRSSHTHDACFSLLAC